jgi:hypothetical protein
LLSLKFKGKALESGSGRGGEKAHRGRKGCCGRVSYLCPCTVALLRWPLTYFVQLIPHRRAKRLKEEEETKRIELEKVAAEE